MADPEIAAAMKAIRALIEEDAKNQAEKKQDANKPRF